MKNMIAPSMMCCDFMHLPETLDIFEKSKIEYLHFDVMDGSFVPNLALGTDFIRQLRHNTKISFDLHLMIEHPESRLDWFPFGEGDFVSVHYESSRHVQKALHQIRERGAKPLLAMNPATPLCCLNEVLDDIDGVLVMSVNPGYAGQALIPHAIEKIKKVREYLDAAGKDDAVIEVDGNVSWENTVPMHRAGANIFVVGSSSVFCGDLESNINRFRSLID